MSERTPSPEQNARNLSLKAAAVAVTLAGALFVTIFLAVTLPEKFGDWRAALPTPGMTAKQADEAILRARYLHEAAVRPVLIKAGWDDAPPTLGRAPGSAGQSRRLTEALWLVRPFPELHATFLSLLTYGSLSQDERLARFRRSAGTLAEVGAILALGTDSPRARGPWFSYYAKGPGQAAAKNTPGNDAQAARAAIYEADLAFARQMLPLFLADFLREADTQATQPRNAADITPPRTDELARAMRLGAVTLRRQRQNPAFPPLVREFLTSGACTAAERYAALPLLAEKPGLPPDEYCAWNKHRVEVDRIPGRVDTSPRHYFYILNPAAPLARELAAQMNERGPLSLGADTGPGIALTRVPRLAPEQSGADRLYLLADTGTALEAAPAYERSRALPVFAGTPYRHMKNQPVVLPLDPAAPRDKALLDWYAADGWKEGRTLLFSATGPAAAVARHWGALHFAWSSTDDGKLRVAFAHPVSGHFMLGALPHLQGKSAAAFLGPVTGLWFGRVNLDKNGWVEELYAARPEAAPAPAAAQSLVSPVIERLAGKTATSPLPKTPAVQGIAFNETIRKAQSDTYGRYYRITLARWTETYFPEDGVSALDRYSFVDNAVSMLREWGMVHGSQQSIAVAYLWAYRNEPETVKKITRAYARANISPGERLHIVRRAVGLPGGKEVHPCYK